MDRIIDISTDDLYLSRERGFFKVSRDGDQVGKVPFDQIAGVLVHANGITWSNSLLATLADQGIPVVICDSKHSPRSVLVPLEGHHAQGGRIRAQWQSKTTLIKQAWKKVVISKIKMQAAVLKAIGESDASLQMMTRKVTSGDKTNVEAQAARIYWPCVFGKEFRRDRFGGNENNLLNYGYTIIRAATMRAVVGAGLHPSIGLHHSNRGNAFALADDLVEPFRPLVDCTVRTISTRIGNDVTSDAKKTLTKIISMDLPLGKERSPVSVALSKLATSLGQSFENEQLSLALPEPPSSSILLGLGL